ncbi:MAG: hypothetical protein PHD97_06870 [Bacteroidales bacterium]|nr:hypothetical protein [Bacteroidales bacterium]
MARKPSNTASIYESILKKDDLKQSVFDNTKNTFNEFRDLVKSIVDNYQKKMAKSSRKELLMFRDKGEFQFELEFASDILVFVLHSNVFEFDRNHEVRKTKYIQDDNARSYCGVILVYNFLSDSFKYGRINDVGYLVARIFINKELHYFIEGKREIGMLYSNFENSVIDKNTVISIVESAMMYCLNFDLLTPPFDNIKEVTVSEVMENLEHMRIKTGKRLGFRFQADKR